MSLDTAKIRRESMRWNILLTLNNARPMGAYEELILSTVQSIYPDATALELRREIDYLADRSLVDLRKEPSGRWFARPHPLRRRCGGIHGRLPARRGAPCQVLGGLINAPRVPRWRPCRPR